MELHKPVSRLNSSDKWAKICAKFEKCELISDYCEKNSIETSAQSLLTKRNIFQNSFDHNVDFYKKSDLEMNKSPSKAFFINSSKSNSETSLPLKNFNGGHVSLNKTNISSAKKIPIGIHSKVTSSMGSTTTQPQFSGKPSFSSPKSTRRLPKSKFGNVSYSTLKYNKSNETLKLKQNENGNKKSEIFLNLKNSGIKDVKDSANLTAKVDRIKSDIKFGRSVSENVRSANNKHAQINKVKSAIELYENKLTSSHPNETKMNVSADSLKSEKLDFRNQNLHSNSSIYNFNQSRSRSKLKLSSSSEEESLNLYKKADSKTSTKQEPEIKFKHSKDDSGISEGEEQFFSDSMCNRLNKITDSPICKSAVEREYTVSEPFDLLLASEKEHFQSKDFSLSNIPNTRQTIYLNSNQNCPHYYSSLPDYVNGVPDEILVGSYETLLKSPHEHYYSVCDVHLCDVNEEGQSNNLMPKRNESTLTGLMAFQDNSQNDSCLTFQVHNLKEEPLHLYDTSENDEWCEISDSESEFQDESSASYAKLKKYRRSKAGENSIMQHVNSYKSWDSKETTWKTLNKDDKGINSSLTSLLSEHLYETIDGFNNSETISEEKPLSNESDNDAANDNIETNIEAALQNLIEDEEEKQTNLQQTSDEKQVSFSENKELPLKTSDSVPAIAEKKKSLIKMVLIRNSYRDSINKKQPLAKKTSTFYVQPTGIDKKHSPMNSPKRRRKINKHKIKKQPSYRAINKKGNESNGYFKRSTSSAYLIEKNKLPEIQFRENEGYGIVNETLDSYELTNEEKKYLNGSSNAKEINQIDERPIVFPRSGTNLSYDSAETDDDLEGTSQTYIKVTDIESMPNPTLRAKMRRKPDIGEDKDIHVRVLRVKRKSSTISGHSYLEFQAINENDVPLYQYYQQGRSDKTVLCYTPEKLCRYGSCNEHDHSSCPISNSTVVYPNGKVPDKINRLSVMELLSPDGINKKILWCELPEVKESGILKKITAEELKLQEAIFEVIQSEGSFIRSLKFLIEHFAYHEKFLEESCILSKQEHQALFSDIIPVKEASERLMADFMYKWSDSILLPDICDILHTHATKHFSVFVKYSSNRIYQERTLKELKKSKPEFLEALQKLENSTECQGLTLESFLILPLQHISRMPHMVDSIFHWLPSPSLTYNICKSTLHTLHKIVTECHESARRMERLEEILLLSSHLDFKECKVIPVNSSRWLLKKGELVRLYDISMKKTFGRTSRTSRTSLYFFLFNDILMVTKKKSDDNYTVLDYCPADKIAVSVEDLSSQQSVLVPENCKHIIYLTLLKNHEDKSVEMVLSCPLESEKIRWLEAFSSLNCSTTNVDQASENLDYLQAQCVQNYIAQQPDELSIQRSDIFTVLKKTDDGWCKGKRLQDKASGWFPTSNVVNITCSTMHVCSLRQCYRLLVSGNSTPKYKK